MLPQVANINECSLVGFRGVCRLAGWCWLISRAGVRGGGEGGCMISNGGV